MFYSETLLSKTGPLARVWLAANIERKLSKSNILQSNIESSVNAIVDEGQAPMALRLSGQLLLGVVRIYSRKARYLLDDCNEALLKIKMAFRPGNVDLPANQSHTVNPASLTLPDVLTEMDLLAPMPDPSQLLAQLPDITKGARDPTLLDQDTNDFLPASIEQTLDAGGEPMLLEDDGIVIDIDEDPTGLSIEAGRNAPAARPIDDDFGLEGGKLPDDDLGLDIEDDPIPVQDSFAISGLDDDVAMGGMDISVVPEVPADAGAAAPGAARQSMSPLSDIQDNIVEDGAAAATAGPITNGAGDLSFAPNDDTTAIDETLMHAQPRTKRRKVLQADAATELNNEEIKAQQADTSRITKPLSLLPRDPLLLQLINLQKSGGFVSSILGDGRSKGWAPELRGVLSLEVVRRSGDLKRKRDSGVADLDDGAPNAATSSPPPGLDFADDDAAHNPSALDFGVDDDGFAVNADNNDDEDQDALSPIPDNFDDTTAPLLHPDDDGPVSLGTKHAVHLLRERFSPSGSNSTPSQRAKASVLFHDLLPVKSTSRSDATKMFFETLVLATKDAIKVEQNTEPLGAPIRIRGKRGLWGAWAEEKAGGEIAAEGEAEAEGAAEEAQSAAGVAADDAGDVSALSVGESTRAMRSGGAVVAAAA